MGGRDSSPVVMYEGHLVITKKKEDRDIGTFLAKKVLFPSSRGQEGFKRAPMAFKKFGT